jgi:hypothetical protein
VLPFLARLEKAEIVQVEASKEGYDKLLGLCESDFEKRILKAIHERKLHFQQMLRRQSSIEMHQ